MLLQLPELPCRDTEDVFQPPERLCYPCSDVPVDGWFQSCRYDLVSSSAHSVSSAVLSSVPFVGRGASLFICQNICFEFCATSGRVAHCHVNLSFSVVVFYRAVQPAETNM